MASVDDVRFRLQVAEGFVNEARDDASLRRWRSCVDNSQLAVENCAKSALALLGPVPRSHTVTDVLAGAIQHQQFPPAAIPVVSRLAELAGQLGRDVHVASDYGDEVERRTPWELFDESAALDSLTVAEEALTITRSLVAVVMDD